jgi:hypothetical protein
VVAIVTIESVAPKEVASGCLALLGLAWAFKVAFRLGCSGRQSHTKSIPSQCVGLFDDGGFEYADAEMIEYPVIKRNGTVSYLRGFVRTNQSR